MLAPLIAALVVASLETVSMLSAASNAQAVASAADASMTGAIAVRIATICTAEDLLTAALLGGLAAGQEPAGQTGGGSTPAARLMSAEKDRQLRRLLPHVADPEIEWVLNDPALVLYTDAEMPKAYQFWGSSHAGIHDAHYNISANGSEPFGNGNREFPWSAPAGTHRSKNVREFRFLWLPRDEAGRPRPVVWYRTRLPGDGALGYAWAFPVGAVVGEVLTLHGPGDGDYTFELRVRKREYGGWNVDVFRPFPRSGDLVARIHELRPDWQSRPDLVRLCGHLEQSATVRPFRLADAHPGARAFDQTMGVDELPPLNDEKLIVDLLTTTTFCSAQGAVWRTADDGTAACAPTTAAAFHIVPANYDAGFIEVDAHSCVRCHETVNQPVDRFDAGRDWYGHIRGSDGIFSFHPFALSSISGNGYSRPVSMRPELQAAGLLEKFDPQKHSHAVYQALTRLVE